MLKIARSVVLTVILILASASSCDDPDGRDGVPTITSDASESASSSPTPTDTTSGSTTPSTSPSARLSGIANRTSMVVSRDGKPIDTAGLAAIGWTVDAEGGTARFSDPALGQISVTWDVPDARAVALFDVSIWGHVTGANLAMSPHILTSGFKGTTTETSAHSLGGQKAEAPVRHMKINVPELPVGSKATVDVNLSWPTPVLVTYNYVYE